MVDWGKYWIRNAADIQLLLANPEIKWKGNHSLIPATGEVEIKSYPLYGEWGVWKFEVKSSTWLELTGSLHKFWNHGTNGNDFLFKDLLTSIINLCNKLLINPCNFSLHNLEYGINIYPKIDTIRILRNIICYKNKESIKAISDNKYFIEFEMDKYYLKMYDKGLQAHNVWNMNIGNVFRVEVKATNSSYYADAGIETLADMLNPNSLQILGKKIIKVFNEVVFDDDTIDPNKMTRHDQKNYMQYRNPEEWAKNKGKKNSKILARENRFREVVAKYGTLNLHHILSEAIADKWRELLTITPDTMQSVDDFLKHCKLCGNSYLIYTQKTSKV